MTDKNIVAIPLDRVLAEYDGNGGVAHIGEPIHAMVERVKDLLDSGVYVQIFTDRFNGLDQLDQVLTMRAITEWSIKHIGRPLDVTPFADNLIADLAA